MTQFFPEPGTPQDDGATVGVFGRTRPRFFRDKILKELFSSSRFYAAAAALLVRLFGEQFGLDETTANSIVQLVAAWIAGESIRPADNPLYSRRFWVTVSGVVAMLLSRTGLELDPQTVQGIVIAIASWVVGDSWRETLSGNAKQWQKQAFASGGTGGTEAAHFMRRGGR